MGYPIQGNEDGLDQGKDKQEHAGPSLEHPSHVLDQSSNLLCKQRLTNLVFELSGKKTMHSSRTDPTLKLSSKKESYSSKLQHHSSRIIEYLEQSTDQQSDGQATLVTCLANGYGHLGLNQDMDVMSAYGSSHQRHGTSLTTLIEPGWIDTRKPSQQQLANT